MCIYLSINKKTANFISESGGYAVAGACSHAVPTVIGSEFQAK